MIERLATPLPCETPRPILSVTIAVRSRLLTVRTGSLTFRFAPRILLLTLLASAAVVPPARSGR